MAPTGTGEVTEERIMVGLASMGTREVTIPMVKDVPCTDGSDPDDEGSSELREERGKGSSP